MNLTSNVEDLIERLRFKGEDMLQEPFDCQHTRFGAYHPIPGKAGIVGDRVCLDCGAISFVPMEDVVPFPDLLPEGARGGRTWKGGKTPP